MIIISIIIIIRTHRSFIEKNFWLSNTSNYYFAYCVNSKRDSLQFLLSGRLCVYDGEDGLNGSQNERTKTIISIDLKKNKNLDFVSTTKTTTTQTKTKTSYRISFFFSFCFTIFSYCRRLLQFCRLSRTHKIRNARPFYTLSVSGA